MNVVSKRSARHRGKYFLTGSSLIKYHHQSHTFIAGGHSPLSTTMMQITIAFEVCSPLNFLLYELHGFVKSVESSNILHRETATAAFHNSKERFDPPKCHPNTRLAVLEKIMKWIKCEEDLDMSVWPRRIWEVCNHTNQCRDVRAGDDLLASFFLSGTTHRAALPTHLLRPSPTRSP